MDHNDFASYERRKARDRADAARDAVQLDSKPIPKSLHTARVFTVLAEALRPLNPAASPEGLVRLAAVQLGYAYANDPHGIIAQAVKNLNAGAAK